MVCCNDWYHDTCVVVSPQVWNRDNSLLWTCIASTLHSFISLFLTVCNALLFKVCLKRGSPYIHKRVPDLMWEWGQFHSMVTLLLERQTWPKPQCRGPLQLDPRPGCSRQTAALHMLQLVSAACLYYTWHLSDWNTEKHNAAQSCSCSSWIARVRTGGTSL